MMKVDLLEPADVFFLTVEEFWTRFVILHLASFVFFLVSPSLSSLSVK